MTRIDTILHAIKDTDCESVFLTSKANVYYMSNYYTDPHERLVAVYADQVGTSLIILPEMEKENALAAGWDGDILPYSDQDNPWELFSKYLKASNRKPSAIGVEKEHLTVKRLEEMTTLFPETNIIDAGDTLANLRIIKDNKEFTTLKQAANLADLGVEIGVAAIREGKTELEIVAEIEYELKKHGIREISFSTMVLTGAKTASPHGNPGLAKISPGDFILFDLGVVLDGYCSDITRTVAYKEISEEQQRIYQTVLEAQKRAIKAATIGTPIGNLDMVARKHITNQGYGKYFTHRIGHGIGIDVHEYPSLTANNVLPLKEGMAFTIEPGIYVPNVGGVRIEDEIFITEDGPQLLTTYPKELKII